MKFNGIYLSICKKGLRLFYENNPLCDYKTRLDEIYLVCKMYKKPIPDVCWNSERLEWVHTSTIDGLI